MLGIEGVIVDWNMYNFLGKDWLFDEAPFQLWI